MIRVLVSVRIWDRVMITAIVQPIRGKSCILW